MSGTSASGLPASEEGDEGQVSSRSRRGPASVLGLAIVSAMNVVTLGFLAYHFAGHPDEPAAHPLGPAIDKPLTALPLTASGAVEAKETMRGNVGLAPASRRVLEIASGISLTETELPEQQRRQAMEPTAPGRSAASRSPRPIAPIEYWVQLGAMSKETTARRFWLRLKRRHASLLEAREPQYFGPAEVGGSLYHVRLGPMDGEAAAALCKKLAAASVDCFCVKPDQQRS